MAMTFENFIVIEAEDKMSSITRGQKYRYTMLDQLIFPVGGLVPIIKEGKGCIGIVQVDSILINSHSTTIEFTGVDTNVERRGELFNMYLMSHPEADMSADPVAAAPKIASSLLNSTKSAQTSRFQKKHYPSGLGLDDDDF